MALPKKPHWIDHLFHKHECYSYDNPDTITVSHDGRIVKVLVPEELTDIQPLVTAENDGILFVFGRRDQKWNDANLGVLLVAKHRDGDTYEAGIWHDLYPWA